jgi:hypothetical protein
MGVTAYITTTEAGKRLSVSQSALLAAHAAMGLSTRKLSDGNRVRVENAVEQHLANTVLGAIRWDGYVRFDLVNEAILQDEGGKTALKNVRRLIDNYLTAILVEGQFSADDISAVKRFRSSLKVETVSRGDRNLFVVPNAKKRESGDTNNGDDMRDTTQQPTGDFIFGGGDAFIPTVDPNDIPDAGLIDPDRTGDPTDDPTPNRDDLERAGSFGDTLGEKVLIGIIAAVIIRMLL